MNYSDVNNTGRAVQGTMKRFFADINGTLDAAGAADAYTLTLNETGYTAYFDGMIFACSIPATNLTATPTIDVNGIGAQTITDLNGNAISIGELAAGGIHEFRYDGTNFRIVGTGGVAGLDTQFQFNNSGIFGGSVGLTYNTGNDEVTVVNPLNVSTDVVMTEQADHTSTPIPGFGYLWVRDDTPSVLIFTDDAGNDVNIAQAAVGTPGGAANAVQFNDGGAFGGEAQFTWDSTNNQLRVASFTADVVTLLVDDLNLTARTQPMLQVDVGGSSDNADGILVDHSGNGGTGAGIRINGTTTGMIIDVDGTLPNEGNGLVINCNNNFGRCGVFTVEAATGNHGLDIDVEEESAYGLQVYSDASGRSRALVEIIMDNAANANAEVLLIQNDSSTGTPSIIINSQAVSGPTIEMNGCGQIQFPSTPVPSTNLNTLDHYVEVEQFVVTFTPTTSGTITIDPSNDELAYVKIGRLVWLQGEISVQSVSSPVGNVEVELPFTSLDAPGIHSQDQTYQPIWIFTLSGLSDGVYTAFINRNSNVLVIQDGDGITPIADNFQAATVVSINVMYMANE